MDGSAEGGCEVPALLAILAGAETFTDIARFGKKKPARFHPFRDGTLPHNGIGGNFAATNAV